MLEKGTVISKRYQIVEKLGSGGMAVAYKARDMRLGRFVTVKVLKDEYSENADFLTKFSAEASAAASLSHHNIVRVYDVGEDNGINYIVMEYIHGQSLKKTIGEKAPFDSVTTLSVAMQIASALSHAHKHHVVHRDIKPQNILVAVDGTVKVTDFGIARAATSNTYAADVNAMGSVHYFSPEQARGGYVNEKSDIYSLGITMYEMATGRVPFDANSSIAVALKHLNEELPDIKQYNPNVTRGLEGIIRKATQKKSDERYDNIDILISDIKLAIIEAVRETKGGKSKTSAEATDKSNQRTAGKAAVVAAAAATGAAAQALNVSAMENNLDDSTIEEIANTADNEAMDGQISLEIGNSNLKSEDAWDDYYEDDLPGANEYSDGPYANVSDDYDDYYDDEDTKTEDENDGELKVEMANDISKKIKLPKSSVGFEKYSKKLKLNNENDSFDDDNDDYDDLDDDDYDDEFADYYEEYDEEKRQEKKVTIAAVITALIIIGVIVFVGIKYFNVFGNISGILKKDTTVPSFIGMNYDEASEDAKDKGITLVKGATVESTEEKDQILSQDVEEGTEITDGMEIIVTVSSGAEAYKLPDVVGFSEADAISKITTALPNANIVLEYKSDDTHEVGTVIEQSPEGNSDVLESVNVVLTVCRDESSINAVVPNVVGLSEDDAKEKIVSSGLSVGNVSRTTSSTVSKGYVITQTATPGEEILKSSTIDIVVSSGRPAAASNNSGNSNSGNSNNGSNSNQEPPASTDNTVDNTQSGNTSSGTNTEDDVPTIGSMGSDTTNSPSANQ